MRTTIAIDDDVPAKAQERARLHEKSAFARGALRATAEIEAAHRFARLAGAMPDVKPPPPRRFK